MPKSSPENGLTSPPRITMRTVSESILSAFSLDKGLLYSLKALSFFPGKAINGYLFEDRTRMMKPLRLLLLVVAGTTYIMLKVIAEAPMTGPGLIPIDGLPSQYQQIGEQLNGLFLKYFNLFLLFKVPFLALEVTGCSSNEP